MPRHAPTIPAGDALLDAATILLATLTALAALGLREGAAPACPAPGPVASAASRERPAAFGSAPGETEAMLRDLVGHD